MANSEWRSSDIAPSAIRHSAIHYSLSEEQQQGYFAMRILVVGAGAIGGYFGGRLLQAGRDVTFLVRPKRASELADRRPRHQEPAGDVTLKNPPTVQADKLTEKFDVVLLSCKAFDLDDAIKSFAPAVGPQDLDHPAAQRHAASGRARREIRPRARARRPLRDRGDAQRGARGGAAGADAVAQFRRTRRHDVGPRPRHRAKSSPAAISARWPANTSCRTCGRNGYSSPRSRPRPA